VEAWHGLNRACDGDCVGCRESGPRDLLSVEVDIGQLDLAMSLWYLTYTYLYSHDRSYVPSAWFFPKTSTDSHWPESPSDGEILPFRRSQHKLTMCMGYLASY